MSYPRLLSSEVRRVFRQPLAWLVLAFGQGLLALWFFLLVIRYLEHQNELRSAGVTVEILMRYFDIAYWSVLLLPPLLTMGSLAADKSSGMLRYLYTTPISNSALVLNKFCAVLSLSLVHVLLVGLLPITLLWGAPIDLGVYFGNLLALVLLTVLHTAIGLLASALTGAVIASALLALSLSLVLWFSDWASRLDAEAQSLAAWSSLARLRGLSQGLLVSSDVAYFMLSSLALLIVTVLLIQLDRRSTGQLRARAGALLLSVLIATSTVYALGWLGRHPVIADISSVGQHSLDPRTASLLERFTAPLTLTLMIPNGHPARLGVEQYFAPYQRLKPDLKLKFFDPQEKLADGGNSAARLGELVMEYQGRKEILTRLNSHDVVNGLARLARAGERYVTFLAANGERQIARQANHDISAFAAYLEARGIKLRELSLGTITQIPDNTAVLVLASPSSDYAAGDRDAITNYLNEGGNLLWLSDPGAPAGLTAIADVLGIQQLPGTLIDPVGLTKFRNPAYTVLAHSEAHATLEGFKQTVVFPYASALAIRSGSDWQATALARSSDDAWTESGPLEGNVGFDADDEVRASHYVALALTRSVKAPDRTVQEQRVVVIGDGDFLSNTFIDNLGNREFGGRMIEWLAHDDALIDVGADVVADPSLELEMWQRLLVFMIFGVGLPISLLANGLLYGWRRRHA